jgi:glycosyltransferase involved in cell wall biosynthesis
VEGPTFRLSRLRRLLARLRPLRVDPARLRLVNPELFIDAVRARCYIDLVGAGASGIGWIIYDFLPWLRPGDFDPGTSRCTMHYLHALHAVPNVAFISAETRRDYAERIMHGRGREGPVISLGHDGLGLARQEFSPSRNRYVCVGTLEARKNVVAIFEAFARLWAEGCSAELVMVGLLNATAQRERSWLEALRAEPRFRYLGHADDATLREILAGARALVFASEAEGFGLPPVEALHVGIPVIVSSRVPSIAMLPPAGQIRLQHADAAAVAAGVRTMQDDAVAARLWAEAASLPTRSWRDFARDVADWAMAMPLASR